LYLVNLEIISGKCIIRRKDRKVQAAKHNLPVFAVVIREVLLLLLKLKKGVYSSTEKKIALE
jgi:hypothetical protein